MRLGSQGEIILLGSRERRYVRKVAKLIGNTSLAAQVWEREAVLYETFFWLEREQVSEEEIQSARFAVPAVHYPILIEQSLESIRDGIASRRAERVVQQTEISLDPDFTAPTLEGLQALVNLNLLEATALFIRRSVAQVMVEEFQRRQGDQAN